MNWWLNFSLLDKNSRLARMTVILIEGWSSLFAIIPIGFGRWTFEPRAWGWPNEVRRPLALVMEVEPHFSVKRGDWTVVFTRKEPYFSSIVLKRTYSMLTINPFLTLLPKAGKGESLLKATRHPSRILGTCFFFLSIAIGMNSTKIPYPLECSKAS